MNAPKLTGAPSVSDSVAGTVPPTGTLGTDVLWKNVVGVSVGLPTPCSHCWKYRSSLARLDASKPAFSAATCLLSAMNAASSALP